MGGLTISQIKKKGCFIMTQKSVNIPDTFRNKDFWLRAVSLMLSLTLMVLCVPSYNSSTASGENQNGNPNVLTNSSVTFRDSKFKNIASVESGESFYLMATIAGNHVNENKEEKYRIEITDNNLALLNFKDNGFTDGAEYNGYILHLERNNNGEITRRYIDFKITGGETKVVRLQAKFLNGKTKAEEKTIKLIQTSTNKSVTGSVDVKATTDWKSSKTEDKSQIKKEDIEKGTVINYTLNASPVNPNAKKGALWVEGLKFTDTLKLPAGMTFKEGAKGTIENMLPQYEKTVTISGNTATIEITVDSRNENAEMPSTTINIPFKLQDVVDIGENFTGGTINNDLTVNGKRYGETNYTYEIGKNTVSAEVVTPAPPKPADFTISKTVNNQEAYYVKGNTVTFTISATNVGEQAGDITLTDVVPTGMTLESITGGTVTGNEGTVKFTDVQPGATVSATVTCKVSTDENTKLTNEVTAGEKSAQADITVKKDEPNITISKGGYVGTSGDTYIKGEDNNVTYTITVRNDGTKEGKFSFTDDLSTINGFTYGSMAIAKDGNSVNSIDGLSYAKNKVTATNCDIGAGETITVTITGTLSVAKDENDPKKNYDVTNSLDNSTSVTFTGRERQANLGITKEAFSDEACTKAITSYISSAEDQTIYYKITVKNTGDADATNVTLTEVPDGVNIEEVKQGDDVLTANEDGTYTISTVSKDNGSVVLIVKAKIPADKTGNITNTAKITYNKETTEGKNIINQDISANAKVEKEVVKVNGKDVNSNVALEEGDKVTYRVKFTNTSNEAIKNLKMFDGSHSLIAVKDGDLSMSPENNNSISFEITDISKASDKFTTNYENEFLYNDKYSAWSGIYFNFDGINLEKDGYIEVEYTMYLKTTNKGTQTDRPSSDNPTGENPNVSADVKPEFNGIGVYNVVKFNTDGSKTYPYQGLSKNPVKQPDFTVSKSATTSSVDTSNVENWRTDPYEYSITLTSKNNNNKYNGKTITITDELPDGMEYIAGQTPTVENATVENTEISEDGKTVTFTLTSTTDLGQYFLNTIKVTYKTKLKDSAVSEIEKLPSGKVFEQTNTVTKVTVTGENFETVEKTPNSKATITFKKKAPAPGFAKLAYASFAGQTFNKNETELNYVNNGYITAGDTLIWNLVLYNGDGSDKYKADTTADIDLSQITLTDYIPNGYEYNNGTGYTATARIISIATGNTTRGDYRQPVYDKDNKVIGQEYKNSIGNSIDIPKESIQYNDSTRKLEIDLSKISGLSKLAPNQCLVIEFVTTATKEREGVVTNNGEATFKNDNIKITNESIVAGERKDDKTIFNSANYNIVGLTTESWKTITYTNQGHTGTPHTDPATDTGNSRTPTHNYVQGMQGEDVTYELHVKNNSPLNLENFVLIDRLPYVNDIGLVSGYSRNSAFSVAYKSIESVEVAGKEVGYEITYSTDKTAVLDEYSKDWIDKNDKMTWTETPTNAINFRIVFDESIKIESGQEVVITFKGTVPSFVENTGEENIAWNSFAYAYQNKEILGSTVMVAEPAKVGVWVEKPQTENKITINKTVDKNPNGATFYFALFGDNTGNKRISDVISLTVPAGQTEASVTMENLDYTSIKEAIEANGSTQADKIYLFETNAKGEVISSSNSVYNVNYTGNDIDISSPDRYQDANVTVTNTKQTKQITVTKTLTGTTTDTDTFYFAVFTKNGNNYVRYEEAGIKSLTMPNTLNTLTFDIPATGNYYVFETNESGVLVDKIENDKQTEYTGSQNGEKYTVTGAGLADGNITITNNKVTNYSITVSKSLSSDKINTAPYR